MKLGCFLADSFLGWVRNVFAIFVSVATHHPSHEHVEPYHFVDGIFLESLLVAAMLVAVEEDAKLSPPVPEVVISDDVVSQKTVEACQRIADDRASKMAHMHRLGHVRRAEVNNDGLGRLDRINADTFVRRDELKL